LISPNCHFALLPIFTDQKISSRYAKFRSSEWFGKKDKMGFIYRSWMKNQGFPEDLFDGRPVIGICNTWSELTPCNAHLRDIAEWVKRGVYEAGGFPLEFPIMSLGETLLKPTAMLFRNLASMDAEESIRGNPIDGVVLLTGCDKTTHSTMMGAASVDLPTIVVPGGPMLNGKYKGQDIGSGTNVWKMTEELKAEKISYKDMRMRKAACHEAWALYDNGNCINHGLHGRIIGHEFIRAAAIPAVDSRKKVLASCQEEEL
jgi:dihydroxy-acid dehydratase